jgi:hypothetical protein
VAILGVNVLLKIVPVNIPRISAISATVGLDWRVMAFAVVLSILTAFVFTILPASAVFRQKLTETLNETGSRQVSAFAPNGFIL